MFTDLVNVVDKSLMYSRVVLGDRDVSRGAVGGQDDGQRGDVSQHSGQPSRRQRGQLWSVTLLSVA